MRIVVLGNEQHTDEAAALALDMGHELIGLAPWTNFESFLEVMAKIDTADMVVYSTGETLSKLKTLVSEGLFDNPSLKKWGEVEPILREAADTNEPWLTFCLGYVYARWGIPIVGYKLPQDHWVTVVLLGSTQNLDELRDVINTISSLSDGTRTSEAVAAAYGEIQGKYKFRR